MITERGSVK